MFTDDIAALGRRDWDADGDVPGGPVRLAVIGLGWFVRETALPSLADADYCVPTTLVTGSPDRPEAVTETAGVERAISYEAYADGLARDAYDAVYVATPNALHPDHAIVAADLGKAVLCEKSLAATVAGAERIERDDGAALKIDAPETDEVREQFDYFARAVATGGAIEPDGADGLADLRAIARAYEAAETGRRTSIDC